MSTNQLFSLNFTISNQSAKGIKSDIRPLSCQRTHYRNLERQKRQNRFKSSSFTYNTELSYLHVTLCAMHIGTAGVPMYYRPTV